MTENEKLQLEYEYLELQNKNLALQAQSENSKKEDPVVNAKPLNTLMERFNDVITLNNNDKIQAGLQMLTKGGDYEDLKKKYREYAAISSAQNPGSGFLGETLGTAASFLMPGAVIKNAPVASAALTGGIYGLLQNVGDENKSADGDKTLKPLAQVGVEKATNTALGALLGGGATKALNKLYPQMGTALYNQPFKKIDAENNKLKGEDLSELARYYGITGSYEEIADKLQAKLGPEFKLNVQDVVDSVDKNISAKDMLSATQGVLPSGPAKAGVQESTDAVSDFLRQSVNQAIDKNKMSKEMVDFKNKFRGYLKEKKAFNASGGTGDQPPLGDFSQVSGVAPDLVQLRKETPVSVRRETLGTYTPGQEKTKFDLPIEKKFDTELGQLVDSRVTQPEFSVQDFPVEAKMMGQINMPVVPTKPQRPQAEIKLSDLLNLKQNIGNEARGGGFPSKSTNSRVSPQKSQLSDVYSAIDNIIKGSISDNVSPEAVQAATDTGKRYSTMALARPKLEQAVASEKGASSLLWDILLGPEKSKMMNSTRLQTTIGKKLENATSTKAQKAIPYFLLPNQGGDEL